MPCLEVIMHVEGCRPISVKAPQGASCGWSEPLDLLDNRLDHWSGKSVDLARERVKKISQSLIGKSFDSPASFDNYLISLGLNREKEVNVTLGLSFAFGLSFLYCYCAKVNQKYYPKVMLNFINGGAHAHGALNIQEIMLVPLKNKPSENLKIGHTVFQNFRKELKYRNLSTAVGDEGGYLLPFEKTEQALDFFKKICDDSGFKAQEDYMFSLDCAANEYYNKKQNTYDVDNVIFTPSDYQNWLLDLSIHYPIFSIEDPFAETDHESYESFMKNKSANLKVIGDDLTISQPEKLKAAVNRQLIDGLILKPNQNGLFSDFQNTIDLARDNDLLTVFSHRSGDTEDHWLTDLAIHFHGDFIKAGALSRSERLAKYNQLLRIEQGYQ